MAQAVSHFRSRMTIRPVVRPPDRALQLLETELKRERAVFAGLPTIVSQSFFLAASSLTKTAVLWLARGPEERDHLASLLRLWFSVNGRDTPFVTTLMNGTPSPFLGAALSRFLDRKPVWFLATSHDVISPLPTPELFKKYSQHFALNDRATPQALTETFVRLGYDTNVSVSEPGTFSHRGGIVDVWPHTEEHPFRFDILDDRIEAIATFNWKTQKTSDAVATVTIPPCVLPKANQSSLVAYLEEHRGSVRVLLPDPEEIKALTPDAADVLERLSSFRRITFLPFDDVKARFDCQAAPLFQRDFSRLAQFLKTKRTWTTWILTARAEELKRRLPETVGHTVSIQEADRSLLNGFASETMKLLVVSDWELFGPEETEPKTRRSERADIVFLAELKPGDYVVHLDHGIGRFQGMSVSEVDGQKREYFLLHYAEDDKLFVPVELADKLSKYIGLAHPKLHRLSGSGWYQMKKKIKDETRTIAEELLKLYAERERVRVEPFPAQTPEEKELAARFLYELTPDQEQAVADIEHDFRGAQPMDRLICGDVGFGKTEVAIRAAFKAVMNGRQVAVLAPTTILAQQHLDTFTERLNGFGKSIEQLSRFRNPKQQKDILDGLALGRIDIVIGTHRLLQSDVRFHNLGLVIIDEEQRFGVQHKERLKTMRLHTHVLTLTATPIPRTLNLALAGIRDITVIETPPEGRKPIETRIEPYHDNIVKRACERELSRNGQVYFVYNNVQSIALRQKELAALLPKARFGIAHGQLPEEELVRVMADFDKRNIDILLCSTIIENGLDLPNVNTLIVDHATNFGLAQLYQLRGRIGRGSNQAYASFLYHAKKLSHEARKRLQALLEARELGSGFRLALRDLEIRGTGSILGEKQHGHVSAVGLTLYTRLLAETIREMKEGVTIEPERDILLDLPLAIRIPTEVEPNEQKRLSFYQKLALENTVDDLLARAKRLFRRSVFPEPVQNLLDVLTLKILGAPIGVTRIAMQKTGGLDSRIVVEFAETLVPAQLKSLIDENAEWQFGERQIKIPLAALGKNWMENVQRTFALLAQSRNVMLKPDELEQKRPRG